MQVQHLSIFINRSSAEVYAYVRNPENLSAWAVGLAQSPVKQLNGEWIADAPFGRVKIRFADDNALGVLDHDVQLDSGVTFHNPMRVISNGSGSEIIFTLFRHPAMTEEQFEGDGCAVVADLRKLKCLLEDR